MATTKKTPKFGELTKNAELCIRFWLDRGWRLEKACAITGHLQVESYPDLKTHAAGDKHIKIKDGVPGGSFGLPQWNGIRKKGYFAYADKQKEPYEDFWTQLEYIAYELNTTEKFAGDELARATTVWGATRAFMHYERPAGYSKFWPTLGSHWDLRLSSAIALYEAYQKKHGYPAKPLPPSA